MKPLLLLHGALGSSAYFDALRRVMTSVHNLHAPDFSGHGASLNDPAGFSIADLAQDVLDYMNAHGLECADIFGYSMGGYVGLYLARHHPERVSRIVTLATKLQWDEAVAARESALLDPDKMEQKVPLLAALLTERHNGKDWKKLVHKTAALLLEMGKNSPLKEADFKELNLPLLLLLGDRDKMVSLEETVAAYKMIPGAQMGMLPSTPHPFEQVDLALIAFYLQHFLST